MIDPVASMFTINSSSDSLLLITSFNTSELSLLIIYTVKGLVAIFCIYCSFYRLSLSFDIDNLYFLHMVCLQKPHAMLCYSFLLHHILCRRKQPIVNFISLSAKILEYFRGTNESLLYILNHSSLLISIDSIFIHFYIYIFIMFFPFRLISCLHRWWVN